MQFSIARENLLEALQKVAGVIERRQTLPILSNVLLRVKEGQLTLIGTDLEIELIATTEVSGENGETTTSARKLLDICRLLPGGSIIHGELKEGKSLQIKAGRSRFSLATLPCDNFPEFSLGEVTAEVQLKAEALKKLLAKTLYAMAQQDVRYYLNGLLLELEGQTIRTVASDGHRLAWCEQSLLEPAATLSQPILPRKGAQELFRLLSGDENVTVQLSSNNIRVELPSIIFFSKLIEGRYPDYRRVFPQDISRILTCDRQELKDAISRVSILSNEQFRGIRLEAGANLLKLSAHNPDQEEAEEELEVNFQGESFHAGYNAGYLGDALAHIDSDEVRLSFADQTFSCLIEDGEDPSVRFIVMPMRL